ARLIVVSNRLPLSLRRTRAGWRVEPSAGGLQSALGPILREQNGLWIGSPGLGPREKDPLLEAELDRLARKHRYAPVSMPPDITRRFYEGFANQTLWPLFHSFPTRFAYDPDGWTAYVTANRRFRDAVLEELEPGDSVWIHDYHLMLLPRMLREVAPEARIGFFLHIPFPPSELLRILPRRDEMLRGLLGADLIGFQTHVDMQHFRRCVLRLLGLPTDMDKLVGHGYSTRFEALPISIAPDEFTSLVENDPDVLRSLEDLRRRFEGRRVLVAVDRLDYTKGIPERVRAFRRLLERAPHLRGKVVLVQVAVPSRERIPEYERLRHEVSDLVGDVNGEFGTPDWTPLVYIRRGISRSELVALYALADVGWVTPLRDGMNLVAKEYVACHRGGTGALLLSEFAGAASELGEAFLVNPYDEERTAATLERVLEMPAEERRERMAQLYLRVTRNDVFTWADRFLKSLDAAANARPVRPEGPLPLSPAEAIEAYLAAERRLILLDYDGTLVPFAARPKEAIPPAHVLSLVARLVRLPATTVAIVSGRSRADLESWFGRTPGLWLVAEHGALIRPPGAGRWELIRSGPPEDWKGRVRPVLEHAVDRTPGSLIEEKEFALVWHHRLSDPEFGEWLAHELVATLEEMLAQTELQAMRGQKTVEVRLAWAHKGAAVERLMALHPGTTFRMAIGDDHTDEDLFTGLPEAWTVRVGPGASAARYWLSSPAEVVGFLDRLAAAGESVSAAQPALPGAEAGLHGRA
ncbi:MAG TPA: bifunctional alpha,alpha-trehalose-phosphate synthase (UDP-forming)/trehalose-phosphatase, partial [Vicinamibacteria bacterium]|nr:bifunctional alpha,alpha-trehalose-phosphate synthase (UDP-forming)/trehalose-phosphatase [Vicinamibacteria bacterium]